MYASQAARAQRRTDQALFAIVQGGMEPDLRQQAARALASEPFPGFAIGGLSVGEPRAITDHLVALTAAELAVVNAELFLADLGRAGAAAE